MRLNTCQPIVIDNYIQTERRVWPYSTPFISFIMTHIPITTYLMNFLFYVKVKITNFKIFYLDEII